MQSKNVNIYAVCFIRIVTRIDLNEINFLGRLKWYQNTYLEVILKISNSTMNMHMINLHFLKQKHRCFQNLIKIVIIFFQQL